jgi:hypothetical protein
VDKFKKKRIRDKKKLTLRKNKLRGKVGENLFKLESGVFGHGAERMHHGGDFVMHPKKKRKGSKKKAKKKNALGVVPVTEIVREFKEGEIVDTKTGNAVLSPLQEVMGATVIKKPVWFCLAVLVMLISIASASCTLSQTTGAMVCTNQTMPEPVKPVPIIETNYAEHPTHSIVITTRITIRNPFLTVQPVTNGTSKFYMMNGIYVSEVICKNYVGGCKEDISVATVIDINHKPTGCVPITDAEWEAWCWMMYNTPDKVDCAAFSPANKAQMRFNMRGC